jgi:conjugal transfer pilus assembly protein TraF
VQYWQQVLLVHPELDTTLNFPTDNSAIAIRNDSNNALIEKIVNEASKHYGLILFYKGNSSISQKMITHLVPFVNASHFSMISVTTDGQPIEGLPNPRSVPLEAVQKTMDLQSRYMPALFLVNLKTQKMSPLSYGFVSTTELKERLLDVVTQYKRFSYEGLGE